MSPVPFIGKWTPNVSLSKTLKFINSKTIMFKVLGGEKTN